MSWLQETGYPPEIQAIRNAIAERIRGQLLYPCPRNKEIGVGIGVDYGYTRWPASTGFRFHPAVDLHAREGADLIACLPGEVVRAGWLSKDYGNTVTIGHIIDQWAIYTRYAHCQGFNVEVGDLVDAGDVVAFVGATGNITGSHVHFEVLFLEEDTRCAYDPVPCFMDPMMGNNGPYWEDRNEVILRERPAPY